VVVVVVVQGAQLVEPEVVREAVGAYPVAASGAVGASVKVSVVDAAAPYP